MKWDKAVDAASKFGTLIPVGGGDPIPLLKDRLIVGRREGCDIVLNFSNISGQHCRMTLEQGYWFVRDLGSRNGTKVDGAPVVRKRLDPKCRIAFAKHEYRLVYEPQDFGAFGPPPPDDDHMEELMKSLANGPRRAAPSQRVGAVKEPQSDRPLGIELLMSRLAHHVFFTLNDASADKVSSLVAACNKYLTDHDGVVNFAVGTRDPDLNRPVNANYDVSLHVIFRDRESHDAYQVAPRHLEFIEQQKSNWKHVAVFDSNLEN